MGPGRFFDKRRCMRFILVVLLWCILLVVCWPVAFLFIIILPLAWIILLPFRIIGFTIEAVFRFVTSLLMLPFRLIGK
jgi:hypothetical protein